jgi:hypothetical protein
VSVFSTAGSRRHGDREAFWWRGGACEPHLACCENRPHVRDD